MNKAIILLFAVLLFAAASHGRRIVRLRRITNIDQNQSNQQGQNVNVGLRGPGRVMGPGGNINQNQQNQQNQNVGPIRGGMGQGGNINQNQQNTQNQNVGPTRGVGQGQINQTQGNVQTQNA